MFMRLTLEITRRARKSARGIPAAERLELAVKLCCYACDPANFDGDVTKMSGADAYRIRHGNYRVLFSIDGTELTILKFGHRRDIYKR